jgi:hypothetical protein
MSMSDLGWATELLTDAFFGLPPANHLFSGANARSKLAYFMRCGCKYALLYGECHVTEEQDAVALWLLPGATHMTPGRMFRAGLFAAPARFGFRTSRLSARSWGTRTRYIVKHFPGRITTC